MGYLSGTDEAGKPNPAALMTRVIRQGGPGAWGQFWQLLRLRFGGAGTNLDEFYTYGLWRRPEGPKILRELLPHSKLKAFNAALRMPHYGPETEVLVDKLATEALLNANGFATSRTLAAYGPAPEGSSAQVLRDAGAIRAYMSDPVNLPLFGKPRADSFARGAVAVVSVDDSRRTLTFLDGMVAPIAALADEIVADWATGYLFQPFYQTHPDLRRHIGQAMASLRIVTLLTDRGVEPYYAVLRIPAKTAMHDGDAVGRRVWGLVDLATGAVVKLRNLRDPLTPDLLHVLDPEVPLLGMVLPHWDEALASVLAAHRRFPGHGILGWDVFLTPDAALLNEVNANPGHVYQAAAARGIRNGDLEPLYARALAHTRAVNARVVKDSVVHAAKPLSPQASSD